MKVLTLSLLLLIGGYKTGFAEDVPLSEVLKDALFAEEAERDLAGAEKAYRKLLRRFDSERVYAATATLRLAEVLKARGETAEAEKLYARVLREFGDQKAVAEVAKERLGDKAKIVGDAMAESKVNRLERILAESPDLLNTEVDGKTPLERAAESGETVVVEYLIGKGVDVNGEMGPYLEYSKGRVPGSPLAKAVAGGHLEAVELLIDAGANLDVGLLQLAARGGHLAVTKTLLEHGMDIDARFSSEVLIAGWEDEKPSAPPVARRRAVRPPSSNVGASAKAKLAWELTALEVAARQGFGEVARLLIDRGADVRGREGGPSTALIDAIDSGDKGLVDLLLTKGVKPNVPAAEGANPLLEASRAGHGEIVRSLIEAGADALWVNESGANLLHYAKGAAVDALIEAGADVDAMVEGWGTPLASIRREPEAEHKVKALLAAGADPNLMGEQSNPPLVLAASYGHLGAVEALLEAGAEATLEGSYGSALSLAVRHPEIVNLLLEAGADPNRTNKYGSTPFLSAVGFGKPAVVERLLKAGAKPNGAGGDSPPPITALRDGLDLYRTGRGNAEEMRQEFTAKARILIEAGADVNAVAVLKEEKDSRSISKSPRRMDNGMGEPVVFKAARWGDVELVRYLISKGASLEVGGEHAYEVVKDGDAELRAELFRQVVFEDARRRGVVRVVLVDSGEVLAETAPVGDEACPYTIFEAFGFTKRNAHLSSGEAKVWRAGSDQAITVNLREVAAAADPAGDIALQWGDVVEFSEQKNDADGGFSVEELDFLRSQLERRVALRWVDGAGNETAKIKVQFGLDARGGIANSELVRPSYHPGDFYHLFPRNGQVRYLVPLLELGGNDEVGNFRPKTWKLTRNGAGGEALTAEFEESTKPSPWLKDGDEVVLRGRRTVRPQSSPGSRKPPPRRVVLPPRSR